VNGKEIAHFEGDHAVDIRLTRHQISARRAELRADPLVILRPGSSDGLTVDYHGDDDRFAVSLVEIAAKAHRPADGTAAMPPPEGAGPTRRRRFH
jgi:hypothetical protein